jgi:DNA-directed RNA polymerase subunit K/omega
LDRLPEGIDSRFRYVILVSKRAEQLIQNPSAKYRGKGRKPTRIAIAEVLAGDVKWQLTPPEPETNDILDFVQPEE